MPYHYLENIAIADTAFEAWGDTVEDMFVAAADATMNVMVGDLGSIRARERRHLHVEDAQIDMLLFQVLQELIYFKDAERLLLRILSVEIRQSEGQLAAAAEASGEQIDPERHDLIVDVKAVTLHRFRVERTHRGWEATVVLDI